MKADHKIWRRVLALTLAMIMLAVSFPIGTFAEEPFGDESLPWIWPVPGSYQITSLDYDTSGALHSQGQAFDIGNNGFSGEQRLDVVSSTDGTVIYIQDTYSESEYRGSGWGNYVIVRCGNTCILYGHLQSISCTYGRIYAGDPIGKMGNTGNSTGVHLHVQAYPAAGTHKDTVIKAFDRYADNPLYSQKFRFLRQLANTSLLYGNRIKTFYNKLSGSYYVYSGGLINDYALVPISADVKVVNQSGAPKRSLPVNDNQFITDTFEPGAVILVNGYYTDGYGKTWLSVNGKDLGFILLEDVGFYDFHSDLTLRDAGIPKGTYGAVSDIVPSGVAEGSNTILSVMLTVTDTDNHIVARSSVAVGASSYRLGRELVDQLNAADLPSGVYSLILTATERGIFPGVDSIDTSVDLFRTSIAIDTSLTDSVAPLVERIDFADVCLTEFTVKARVSDNHNVTSVDFQFTFPDGSKKVYEGIPENTGGIFYATLSSDEWGNMTGECQVTAAAYDRDHNEGSATAQFILPSAPVSHEIWTAKEVIRIRQSPGLSGKLIGSVSAGTVFTVYEKVSADGYLWGKTENGYIALDFAELTAVIDEEPLEEHWILNELVRVRSGPGLSYVILTALPAETEITVYEIVEADNYRWGHFSDGWLALDLCEYSSGHLYRVTLDPSGGSFSEPVPALKKHFNEPVILPDAEPVRDGYAFLGWVSDATSDTPIKPGDKFDGNRSAVLFALWENLQVPVISSVEASTSDWTNQPVLVTVSVSDSAERLFYSFDGGITYQADNAFRVSENTVFDAGTITVRDASGHIVKYNKAFAVSCIDTVPPDLSNVSAVLTPSGNSVSFKCLNAVDSESGICSYRLMVRRGSEDAEPETIVLSSNECVVYNIKNGAYFPTLAVFDAAGNCSTVDLPRFRIGSAEQLPIPEGLTISDVNASGARFSWNQDKLADRYILQLSKTESFIDAKSYQIDGKNNFQVSGLSAGMTFYYRLIASSTDGVYLPSEPTKPASFVTMSNDNTVRRIQGISDAVIDNDINVIRCRVSYDASTLDITPVIDQSAHYGYFSDQALQNPITSPAAFAFTGKTTTLYLSVSSESGIGRVYAVIFTRASEVAATPKYELSATDIVLNLGDEVPDLSVLARVSDGGSIAIRWFGGRFGSDEVFLGSKETLTPVLDGGGEYRFYAEITNVNEKCRVSSVSVISDPIIIHVKKLVSTPILSVENMTYNGTKPITRVSNYLGDGDIHIAYYVDAECQHPIECPVDAGTYYAMASADETNRYEAASSDVVRFTILRAIRIGSPICEISYPTLRRDYGTVQVLSDDVEMKVGDDKWVPASAEPIVIPEGGMITLRFAETKNYEAGIPVTVNISRFLGARSILPEKSYGVLVEGKTLLLLEPADLKVGDLSLILSNSRGVQVWSKDGGPMSDDHRIVTGDQFVIVDKEGIYDSVTVALRGDVNGDGIISREDAELAMMMANGMVVPSVESAYYESADFDRDGQLTSADAYAILMASFSLPSETI